MKHDHRICFRTLLVLSLGCASLFTADNRTAPAAAQSVPDALGQTLQRFMVWSAPAVAGKPRFVAFRRMFTLPKPAKKT
jgi:hypothetical protein